MPVSHLYRKDHRFFSPVISALAIVVFIGGCAVPSAVEWTTEEPIEPSSFGSEWDSSMGRLGVAPVIPPTEDLRVGDIFVYPFNPDFPAVRGAGRNPVSGLSISPRWASMNLLQQLDEEYQLRPDWPKTPDNYLQISASPKGREWAEARTSDEQGIFSEEKVTDRLRIMGIPEFQSVTFDNKDAHGLVPSEAINLVFGSAWNDNKAITFRMNAAETYSLGLQKVIEAALESDAQGYSLKAPYRDHLALVSDPASDSVWVRVLSDVIYIRSMDIIIQSQAAFETDEAATADEFISEVEEAEELVKEAAQAAGEELKQPAAGEESMQTVAEAIPGHELDPAYAAFVRAAAINEILIESDMDDLPGGFLRMISVTDDSVTLRRVWQRGLAIGARGLTLEVDKATGQILRSNNMGTLLPPPPPPPAPAAE